MTDGQSTYRRDDDALTVLKGVHEELNELKEQLIEDMTEKDQMKDGEEHMFVMEMEVTVEEQKFATTEKNKLAAVKEEHRAAVEVEKLSTTKKTTLAAIEKKKLVAVEE